LKPTQRSRDHALKTSEKFLNLGSRHLLENHGDGEAVTVGLASSVTVSLHPSQPWIAFYFPDRSLDIVEGTLGDKTAANVLNYQ
jgi:hypothetical protein